MNPWTPLAAATLGWGLSNVLSKAVLNADIDTFDFLPLRYSIGLVALVAFLAATGRLYRPELAVWKKGTVLGLLNMSVPTLFMTKGLEFIPATVGSLLIALIPIASVLAAHYIVPDEPFRPRTLPGLALSLIGVGFLISGGSEVVPDLSDLIVGVTLTTIGVLLAGVGAAISRRYTLTTPSEQLVLPQFATGLLTLLIILAFVGGGTESAPFDSGIWWLIIASGTLGTAVPFAAYLFAAELNPTRRLAITGYVVPMLAAIGAILFLGESFTIFMIVGAVLILAGVYMSERAAKYAPVVGEASTA